MKSFFEFYQKIVREQQLAPDAMTTGSDGGAMMNMPQNQPDQSQQPDAGQDSSAQDMSQDAGQGISPPMGFHEISQAMDALQKVLPQDDDEITAKFKELSDLLSKKGNSGQDQQQQGQPQDQGQDQGQQQPNQ